MRALDVTKCSISIARAIAAGRARQRAHQRRGVGRLRSAPDERIHRPVRSSNSLARNRRMAGCSRQHVAASSGLRPPPCARSERRSGQAGSEVTSCRQPSRPPAPVSRRQMVTPHRRPRAHAVAREIGLHPSTSSNGAGIATIGYIRRARPVRARRSRPQQFHRETVMERQMPETGEITGDSDMLRAWP